jgi:hypothetical protein
MIPTGARLFFAYALFALLGAWAYGLATGGDPLGVVSLGYKGGVGEYLGYSILVALSVVSLAAGTILAVIRDADPQPVGEADAVPLAAAPDSPSIWPLVGAFGVVIALLGLAADPLLFVVGCVLVAITIVEWAVAVWADRATGDPQVNRRIRNRVMAPIEIPVGAVLVIAFVVIGLSRLFLSLSPIGAVVAGTIAASLVLVAAILVVSRHDGGRVLVTALLLVGGLSVLAAGVVGVAVGEREFHEPHAEEEHAE